MSDITPSDTQYAAIKETKEWFNNLEYDEEGKLLEGQKQIFRVFGYAGSGKTTITKHVIKELNLSLDPLLPDVRFCAFTGKAALVMRRSGTPARTVHSLIYSVHEATEQEIEEVKKKITELEIEYRIAETKDKLIISSQIEAFYQDIKHMKQPQFGINLDSEAKDAKLIVLDEVSMVGPEMAADILSFRKPVLVLGDPGQLPPIKGEGAFTQQKPDVMLTEIHRQAAESPIIRLATMARQGEFIPYGRHSDDVWKMSRRDATPEMLIAGGSQSQVICGRNATRLELNNAMRRASGFDLSNPLPNSSDEKIICLKNKNSIGLINGMFLELSDIDYIDYVRFRAVVKTEDGDYPSEDKDRKLNIYSGHFEDHTFFDKDRSDRDWKIKKNLVEATFGYAITCHKSQGSGWPYVIVWDDGLGRTKEDKARWLYTAITRAIDGLLIFD